ncbi:MAG: hypothetical protein KJ600_01840 [Nanoarchaeota archaeon]|nr:hypothetical protein [Nanoarchaeota archaeon]
MKRGIVVLLFLFILLAYFGNGAVEASLGKMQEDRRLDVPSSSSSSEKAIQTVPEQPYSCGECSEEERGCTYLDSDCGGGHGAWNCELIDGCWKKIYACCREGYVCEEGTCHEAPTTELAFGKNPAFYSEKEVFIISDADWRAVLQLVPVTTWTKMENCDDGLDNDGDGWIDDEDSDCAPPECGPGEQRLCPNQQGVCENSQETCNLHSHWPGCDYSSIETYESIEVTCDDLDNDCDGMIDEDYVCQQSFYLDDILGDVVDPDQSEYAASLDIDGVNLLDNGENQMIVTVELAGSSGQIPLPPSGLTFEYEIYITSIFSRITLSDSGSLTCEYPCLGQPSISGNKIEFVFDQPFPSPGELVKANTKLNSFTTWADEAWVFIPQDKSGSDGGVLKSPPDEDNDFAKVYPTLIYHQEDDNFDIDSIIFFLQQYSPTKVTLVGNPPPDLANLLITPPEIGAGLSPDDIRSIQVQNYSKYWVDYLDVVYVQDDYDLALVASVYASLLNAPLIIEGSELDLPENFQNKHVICVGSVVPTSGSCGEKYSLQELQQEYIDRTNTNKIILVNPNDLNIYKDEEYSPEKGGGPINNLVERTSLSAPFLASAKHELILTVQNAGYQEVDNSFKAQLLNLQIEPEYLTIIAAPPAIEMFNYSTKNEVDNSVYGNLDSDVFQELAVGRIFSITSSDVSANIARNIFYPQMQKDNDFSVIWPSAEADHGAVWKSPSLAVEDIFTSMGFNSVSFLTDYSYAPHPSNYENKFMLTYSDHASAVGGYYHFSSSSFDQAHIWLNSPLVFMDGCSSCAYRDDGSASSLFCSNLLKRGAVFHAGATTKASGSSIHPKLIIEELLIHEDIGTAMKKARNKAKYDKYSILIGDPTLKVELPDPGLSSGVTIGLEQVNETEYYVDVNVPELHRDVYINYTKDNKRTECYFMRYPFNPEAIQMSSGGCEIFDSLTGELLSSWMTHKTVVGSVLSLPEGYEPGQVLKVQYINSTGVFNVTSMLIYKTQPPPIEDYIFFSKDEGIDNNYFFEMEYSYWRTVEGFFEPEIIEEHTLRVFFQVEEEIP